MAITIQHFFDQETASLTYVVFDVATRQAAIIDPVLNFDPDSGRTNTKSADRVIYYIQENNLELAWILETHIHADHLTASQYIKSKVGGCIGIGAHIIEVLNFWVPILNTAADTPLDGALFDKRFVDNDAIQLGKTEIRVLETPGHTPMCCSYLVEDAIFVGDALFMPDVGTGRTDFPGGSAALLYESIQRILNLPEDTRIFTGHDYPENARDIACVSSVKAQKENNAMINAGISKMEFIDMRNKRDQNKPVPRLLFPSIQFNLRAGSFGKPEINGAHYIKIPINKM